MSSSSFVTQLHFASKPDDVNLDHRLATVLAYVTPVGYGVEIIDQVSGHIFFHMWINLLDPHTGQPNQDDENAMEGGICLHFVRDGEDSVHAMMFGLFCSTIFEQVSIQFMEVRRPGAVAMGNVEMPAKLFSDELIDNRRLDVFEQALKDVDINLN